MIIRDIQMNMSAVKKEQYPDDGMPQIAMVGRSNVGKSSMINTLLNRRKFARISQTPGKTRTINFYKINEEFYLVDLPGYGYAKLSKSEKDSWGKVMEEYFLNAKNLEEVFILVDIRHKPKAEDLMMFDFSRHHQIPVTIIATKSDKLSRSEQIKSIALIKKSFGLLSEKVFPLSALKKTGGAEIWAHIEAVFENGGYTIRCK